MLITTSNILSKMTKSFMLTGRTTSTEKASYNPLLQHEDEEAAVPSSLSQRTQSNRGAYHYIVSGLSLVLKATLFGFAIWGLANVGRHTFDISIAPVQRSCSCGGTTVAEAKARGCIFTPLAIAWLPPHCIDMELANEFDNAGPEEGWPYYADLNGTIPMTREEVSMLADVEGGVFYTTQDWHVSHCVFVSESRPKAQYQL
jgi:hypothetical protein